METAVAGVVAEVFAEYFVPAVKEEKQDDVADVLLSGSGQPTECKQRT